MGTKTIIGIDPGITGAVAILGKDYVVYDTPTEEIKSGKTKKNDFLPIVMSGLLAGYYPNDTHVFIEKVGAMPGQGVTSMFNFGKGFGIWIGILAALGLPYTLVTPQSWKKVMMAGCSDKDAARGMALRYCPQFAGELTRKKDIGRADAILIAEFGRRMMI